MSDSPDNQKRCDFISTSPQSTFSLGKRLGEKLVAGSIVALIGELGCGKTLFTKGICVGLGVPERRVNSPTFAFVNEYSGRLPVFHIDLYRIDELTEEFGIGILDYLTRAGSGVMVLEWAEKALSPLPEGHLRVYFETLSARKRKLTFIGFRGKSDGLIGEISKQ